MSDFDLSGFLSEKGWPVTGIPSEKYPDGNRRYVIPSPTGLDGHLLRNISKALFESDSKVTPRVQALLDQYCTDADGNDVDFNAKLCGDAWQQMLDDGVLMTDMERAAQAAFTRYANSEEALRFIIEAEGKAAARQNRAARRAAAKKPPSPPKGGSRSTGTSGASRSRRTAAGGSTPASRTSARPPASKAS